MPIYPIALCSYASPRRAAPAQYGIQIATRTVLDFQFQVIQLNQFDWRLFLNTTNPVAVALMARMAIAAAERWQVKAASLRLLAGLPLSGVQWRLIGQFIEIYLPLSTAQERAFQHEVAGFGPQEQEGVLEGQRQLLAQLLQHKFGTLPAEMSARLNLLTSAEVVTLGEALLTWTAIDDLKIWFAALPPAVPPSLPEHTERQPA